MPSTTILSSPTRPPLRSVASFSPQNPALFPPGATPRKVVFDLDDVLWGHQRRILDALGIPYENYTEFKTEEAPLLTAAEREQLLRSYGELYFYEGLDFYPGLGGLKNLAKYNAEIWIKSNSFSQEIADFKRQRLATVLPDLTADRIILDVVNQQTVLHKAFDEDVFAAIDDSPYYIAKSRARYNIMPMHPWNQSPKARQMVADKDVFYVPAGDVSIICALLQTLLLDEAA